MVEVTVKISHQYRNVVSQLVEILSPSHFSLYILYCEHLILAQLTIFKCFYFCA